MFFRRRYRGPRHRCGLVPTTRSGTGKRGRSTSGFIRSMPVSAIAGLSISPDGQSVAMRFGSLRGLTPPVIYDTETEQTTLLVADAVAQRLVGRARRARPGVFWPARCRRRWSMASRPNARRSCLCRANCRPTTPRTYGSIASPASVRRFDSDGLIGLSPRSNLARDRLNPKLGSFSTTCGCLPGGCRRTRQSRATAHDPRERLRSSAYGPSSSGQGANARKPAPSSIISSLVATRIGARWKRRRTGWFSRRPSVHSRSGLSTSPRWRPRPSSPSRRSIAIFPVTFSTLASSFLLTPRGRRLSNVAADRFRSHLFRAESCPDFVRDLDVARTIGYAPGKKLFAKSLTFGSRFNGTVREAWEVAADGMVELGLGDRVP